MRARQVIAHALLIVAIPLRPDVRADGNPATAQAPRAAGSAPSSVAPDTAKPTQAPLAGASRPADTSPPTPVPPNPVVAPGSLAELGRARAGAEARLKELTADPKKDNPASKLSREVLERRLKLLAEWKEAADQREQAEHPTPSPEQEAAECRVELDRTRALLEQANKTPEALLPEAFGTVAAGAAAKSAEARLAEMKEAIDAARAEIKERATELETLRGEAAKPHAGEVATLRAERDKIHQSMAVLIAGRAEREAATASAGSPEARELARDRFTNYEWECRVEAERLAAKEARIALATKRGELGSLRLQAKAGRVELDHRLLGLMEKRYALQSETQQNDLKQAVAKEETKAAHTDDVLERYRAKRSVDLLEREAEAVAYEKAAATTRPGLSVSEQTALADEAGNNFEKLKTMLSDGNVSPLDVLRLKNEFRRIGPVRTAIVRGDLTEIKSLLSTYENALADAEIDLINDSRDDRYDREALLDKLPDQRRREADIMLDAMEVRHRGLLNRCRDVLQSLAQRTEDTQTQILRRIQILDEQYAFIRTHIFWVRDAEPVGPATLGHARNEAVRGVRALAKLTAETWDRTLWGRVAPDFLLAIVGLVVLPWPLRLGQQAMDRLRRAAPDPTSTPENAPSTVVG